jgi:hypothetical protein
MGRLWTVSVDISAKKVCQVFLLHTQWNLFMQVIGLADSAVPR